MKAIECYLALPRPSSDVCRFFLFTTKLTTECVSVPKCIKAFGIRMIRGSIIPTVNQVRKYFHKQLMALTKDEESLKDMMRILDAHGRKIQDKHYIIKTPEDDLALAKALVEKVSMFIMHVCGGIFLFNVYVI